MFDPENDEEVRKEYPIQAAEADQISDAIGEAFSKAVAAIFPFVSVVHSSVQGYAELKVKQFKAKLQTFMEASDLKEEQINSFMLNCSDEEKIWIQEFLFETLYSADEKEKCKLYGYIFHELVLGYITRNEARRLIYGVKNLFVEDLEKLDSYSPQKIGDDDVSIPLENAGLLRDNGSNSGVIRDEGEDEEDENAGTIYILSERGRLLLKILEKHRWLPVVSKP